MATKKQAVTLTLEGDMLTHVRNAWGKTSPIFVDANGKLQRGKVVTLLNLNATLMGEWLTANPVVKQEELPVATSFKHEIRTKKGAAAGTGWTWLTFNGRISKELFDVLTNKDGLAFRMSKKHSKGNVVAFYATTEHTEKAVKKVVKL